MIFNDIEGIKETGFTGFKKMSDLFRKKSIGTVVLKHCPQRTDNRVFVYNS
jgi:hypothetical protein